MRPRVSILLSLVAGFTVVGTITLSVAARQGIYVPFISGDGDMERIRAFSGFPVYYVGESFEGLPLTDSIMRLQSKRIESEPARGDFFGFRYGDCEPSGNDGGCPLPLKIQTFPACERTLSSYSMGGQPMPHERVTLRGVPAAFFENGGRLELYTGRITVVMFGTGRDQLQRAAEALVPVNFDGTSAGNLPAPAPGALAGRLTCEGQNQTAPR